VFIREGLGSLDELIQLGNEHPGALDQERYLRVFELLRAVTQNARNVLEGAPLNLPWYAKPDIAKKKTPVGEPGSYAYIRTKGGRCVCKGGKLMAVVASGSPASASKRSRPAAA
jgi:hypothetical protein